MPNTATQKQIDYINSLKSQRDLDAETTQVLEKARDLWRANSFSTLAASIVIDDLRKQPLAQTPAPVVEADLEGMHKIGDQIYKVQRAVQGSGNLYAKALVLTEPDCGGCANGEPCGAECEWSVSFEYAPGVVKTLSASTKMSLEEAKSFGALYGTCCVCGRTLTNEESIAAGIGPVCAGKF